MFLETTFQIFVLQDTDLLRFVFARDPNAVRPRLPRFKEEVEEFLTK